MKVKEVSTTATIAWSPKSIAAPHLVCATAAEHADPTSKNDAVQVYSLNLGEENLSMKLSGSVSTPTRFHDVVWGVGGAQVEGGGGVVACAGDNGSIYVYNGQKLISGDSSALLTTMEGKHHGPVYSLDLNHFQPNLLASGSRDCEIYIWDINDPKTPMSPGTKATLAADVTGVAWNRQVEHILASAYGGRCVVFDLRKNTSIVQISDAVSRMKASSMCWHPNVATQLVLASADDTTPVCQLWDLRFASAPVRQFDGHQRGIQSMAWCQQDPDLLCTASKDNRVFCWSINENAPVAELPSYNQWSFSVSWCSRDPALVATASVDGSVSVYSLLGGGYPPPKDVKFSAIADSFPGMEMPADVPTASQPQSIYLRTPPAFLAPRAGCSFGFGGRLLSWHSKSRAVEISQVVTEPQLLEHSQQLLTTLQGGGLPQYCADKLAGADGEAEKEVWQFINASLDKETASNRYLTLLGHPPPSSPQRLSPQQEDGLAAQMGGLATADGSTGSLDPSEQFEMIASAQSCDKTPEPELVDSEWPTPEARQVVVSAAGDGCDIRRAVISGQLSEAVELCLQGSKYSLALVLAQYSGQDLYQKTRERVLSLENDSDLLCGLVGAVVRADLDSVVSQCSLKDWRQAAVTVLTHAPQEQVTPLLQRLGSRLEEGDSLHSALLCYLLAGALDSFVQCWLSTRQDEAGLSTDRLQELVEMILVVQQTGRSVTLDNNNNSVGRCLAQYASLLATQGALSTALHYLAGNAEAETQAELVALKDRLSKALGYTAPAAVRPTAMGGVPGSRNRSTSTTSNTSLSATGGYRRSSTPSSAFQPPQFTPSVQARQATAFSQPPPVVSQPPAAGQPQFFQPQPVAQQPQSFAPPPPQMAQPVPQYGGFQPGPPMPSGPPPPAPPAATVSAPGGLRRQTTSRYVSTPSVQPGMPPQPVPSMTPFQPYQPSTNLPAAAPPTFHDPSSSFPPGTAHPPPTASLPYGGADTAQPGVPATGEPSKPPAAYDPSVPRGWNDPPPMSASRKAKQQQQQQQQAAAASAAEPVNAMVPAQVQPYQPPQQQGFQGFQGFQQSAPPNGFGGVGAPPPPQQQPGPPPPKSAVGQQTRPSPAGTPLPLPAEAQGVYNVLNGLYTRAVMTAPNMNARQTFESVAPKLELLYDKLRNGQISATTLQGLRSLVEFVEAGDYHRALQVHSQTVSAGNFAEMSPFMPAIRKMLNTCMQCQIFLN